MVSSVRRLSLISSHPDSGRQANAHLCQLLSIGLSDHVDTRPVQTPALTLCSLHAAEVYFCGDAESKAGVRSFIQQAPRRPRLPETGGKEAALSYCSATLCSRFRRRLLHESYETTAEVAFLDSSSLAVGSSAVQRPELVLGIFRSFEVPVPWAVSNVFRHLPAPVLAAQPARRARYMSSLGQQVLVPFRRRPTPAAGLLPRFELFLGPRSELAGFGGINLPTYLFLRECFKSDRGLQRSARYAVGSPRPPDTFAVPPPCRSSAGLAAPRRRTCRGSSPSSARTGCTCGAATRATPSASARSPASSASDPPAAARSAHDCAAWESWGQASLPSCRKKPMAVRSAPGST